MPPLPDWFPHILYVKRDGPGVPASSGIDLPLRPPGLRKVVQSLLSLDHLLLWEYSIT